MTATKTTTPATMAPMTAGDSPDFALDAMAPVAADPVEETVLIDESDVWVAEDDPVDELDHHSGTGGGVGMLASRAI